MSESSSSVVLAANALHPMLPVAVESMSHLIPTSIPVATPVNLPQLIMPVQSVLTMEGAYVTRKCQAFITLL
jgi:hypothetical protein